MGYLFPGSIRRPVVHVVQGVGKPNAPFLKPLQTVFKRLPARPTNGAFEQSISFRRAPLADQPETAVFGRGKDDGLFPQEPKGPPDVPPPHPGMSLPINTTRPGGNSKNGFIIRWPKSPEPCKSTLRPVNHAGGNVPP